MSSRRPFLSLCRARSQSRSQFPQAFAAAVVLTALIACFAERPARGQDAAPAQPATAADGKWLSIIGAVPLPGDVLTDRIVLFFDGQLAPLEAKDNGAAPAPFTVDPPIAGKSIVGPNYVAFEFKATKDPRYRVLRLTLDPALRSTDGRQIDPQQLRHAFATFVFEPAPLFEIARDADRTIVGLRFPAPVALDDLKQRLSAKDADGAIVPLDAQPGTDPQTFRLAIPAAAKLPATVTVAQGLTDERGELRLSADRDLTYPAPPSLSVAGCEWGRFDDKRQQVNLRFSAPVRAADLAQALTITDISTTVPRLIEFTVAAPSKKEWDRAQSVTLRGVDPYDVKILIEIARGYQGEKQTTLQAPFSRRLENKSQLRVEWSYFNDRGAEGQVLECYLNESVDPAELKKLLEVKPPLPNMRVVLESGSDISIFGRWESERTYDVVIAPGLRFKQWATTQAPVIRRVKAPKFRGRLRFSGEGQYYFPRRGGAALSLVSDGLPSAELAVYRLFPSNVAVARDGIADGAGSTWFNESWCERLSTTKLAIAQTPGESATTELDLATLLPADRRGVFCLEARAPKPPAGAREDWSTRVQPATKIVLLTDIGALAHWQDNELALFAHNLWTLEPLAFAKVSVYSNKNQLIGGGVANEQGVYLMRAPNPQLGAPSVVVIEHEGDYTFLELDTAQDTKLPFTPAMPPFDRTRYDGFLYADRELYRPGELVHLRWIVRANYGDAVSSVPLLLSIVKPNGKNLLSRPVVLSEFGSGAFDLPTQKQYPTGRYTARLQVPGANDALGSYAFQLEEFVPNRIKATVRVPEPRWIGAGPHAIAMNAQHLFGKAASDRKCEATVLLKRGYTMSRWPGYRFDNDSDFEQSPLSCGEQRTDDNGDARFEFLYDVPPNATFPMRATVMGKAFELGGRTVNATASAAFFPSDLCLGVKGEATPDGQSVIVSLVAARPDESPANLDHVTVTLERQSWSYFVRRYYAGNEANFSESFETVESRAVSLVNGAGSTSFPAADYGYYRVRVSSDRTPQFSTFHFQSYGGRVLIVTAPAPSLIKIALDRPAHAIGDVAEARIESPFDGRALVVVQGDAIQKVMVVNVEKGVGVARFEVGREQCPNVWIAATVIHALDREHRKVYPFSSFAMANLVVTNPERRLSVALPSLPVEIRPAQKVQFVVEVLDATSAPAQAEVTLAAVDEGIHGITDYKHPDPLAFFARPRRADVRRAHYYDKIAYDFDKPEPGGDGAAIAKRLGQPGANWIKTIALWSGVVRTGANGRATVTMDVPEFNGQLRLVAVALNASATGAQSAPLYVRRPFIMQTSMPRFLLPGDTIQCLATVYNNTDTTCSARVQWSRGGALIDGEGARELTIAPHDENSALARFAAGLQIGQGEIRWEAVIRDAAGAEIERLTQVAPIPVAEPAAFQSHDELRVVRPGETVTLRHTRFMDNNLAEIELTAGASPLLRLHKALRFVADYPYGCVEQTVSRLMPLYLARKSNALAQATLKHLGDLDAYLADGIDRLFAMQTASGGLSYWPGASQPYPYGSVQALHFLTLVRNGREFPLPQDNLELLQRYVRERAEDWQKDGPADRYLRAYATYVLALGGDLRGIELIDSFDNVPLPPAGRQLLAAALARATKDADRVRQYLANAPTVPFDERELGGTLNSIARNDAVELLALRQLDAPAEQQAAQAAKLLAYLDATPYGSTQEFGFIATALCEYLGDMAADIEQAAATIDGPKGKTELRGREVFSGAHSGPGGAFVIANTGGADLYVNLTTRGVPEKPETGAISQGVTIRRAFYTSQGKPCDGAQFAQGESYVVALEIVCERPVENLIVSDQLPGAFEIENPRLNANALQGRQFAAAVAPSHLEVRDERLVLAFDRLGANNRPDDQPHRFYYAVNCVTPGTFQYPPIHAECMYDATIRGASAPATIEARAQ